MRREDARTRTIVLRRTGLCATILNCLVLQAMTQQSERVHWLDRGKAASSKHLSTVDGSAKPHTWWFESYVSLHNSIRNGTSPPRYVVWTCGPLSQVAERRHNSDASPGPEQDSPWMKQDIFDAPNAAGPRPSRGAADGDYDGCTGYGNRLYGIATALLYGLLTDRALLIQWPGNAQAALEHFMTPASDGFDWRANRLQIELDQLSWVALDDRVSRKHFRTVLRSRNLVALHPQQVVYLTCNEAFFLDLFYNPWQQLRLQQLGISSPDQVFGLLGKILQASTLVEEQVRGVMAEAGSCGVLALQVRMGTSGTSAYSVLEQSDLGLFWLAAMDLEARMLAGRETGGCVKWLISSDDTSVIHQLQNLIGPSKVLWYPGEVVHTDSRGASRAQLLKVVSSAMPFAFPRVQLQFVRRRAACLTLTYLVLCIYRHEQIFVDHQLISIADEVIITVPSSFGFTARLLNRTHATHLRALVSARYRSLPRQNLMLASRQPHEVYWCGKEDTCFCGPVGVAGDLCPRLEDGISFFLDLKQSTISTAVLRWIQERGPPQGPPQGKGNEMRVVASEHVATALHEAASALKSCDELGGVGCNFLNSHRAQDDTLLVFNLSIYAKVYDETHQPVRVAILASQGFQGSAMPDVGSSQVTKEDTLEIWFDQDEGLSLPLHEACSPDFGLAGNAVSTSTEIQGQQREKGRGKWEERWQLQGDQGGRCDLSIVLPRTSLELQREHEGAPEKDGIHILGAMVTSARRPWMKDVVEINVDMNQSQSQSNLFLDHRQQSQATVLQEPYQKLQPALAAEDEEKQPATGKINVMTVATKAFSNDTQATLRQVHGLITSAIQELREHEEKMHSPDDNENSLTRLDVVVLPELFAYNPYATLNASAEQIPSMPNAYSSAREPRAAEPAGQNQNLGSTNARPESSGHANAVLPHCMAWAREFSCYIVCTLVERANAPDNHEVDSSRSVLYNSAVLLDRRGDVVGVYRKIFPTYGNYEEGGLTPGPAALPQVFETDFGRCAILVCFDAYFAELWAYLDTHEAAVDVVLFPSAFAATRLLSSYASIHNYYIVENGDRGAFFDIDGSQIVFSEWAGGLVRVARLDLDRQLVCVSDPHNAGTVRFAYMRPYLQGSLEARWLPDGDNRWLLSSRHAQVSVRKEMEKLAIQDVRVFRRRARDFLNYLRRRGRPCPGHGGLDEEDFDPDDSMGHADEIVIRLWHLAHAGPREHAVPWCSPWPQCRRQLSLLLARPQSQQSEQDDSSKTQRDKTNQSGGPLVFAHSRADALIMSHLLVALQSFKVDVMHIAVGGHTGVAGASEAEIRDIFSSRLDFANHHHTFSSINAGDQSSVNRSDATVLAQTVVGMDQVLELKRPDFLCLVSGGGASTRPLPTLQRRQRRLLSGHKDTTPAITGAMLAAEMRDVPIVWVE